MCGGAQGAIITLSYVSVMLKVNVGNLGIVYLD